MASSVERNRSRRRFGAGQNARVSLQHPEGSVLAEKSLRTWADIIRGEARRRAALTIADEWRHRQHVLEDLVDETDLRTL
jgi:hypothetical protein